jgi:hypothetical protein
MSGLKERRIREHTLSIKVQESQHHILDTHKRTGTARRSIHQEIIDLCEGSSHSAGEGNRASDGKANLGNSAAGMGGISGSTGTGACGTRGTDMGGGPTWIGA